MRICLAIAAALLTLTARPDAVVQGGRARNVVIVTIDGFRWQELFGGADRTLFRRTSTGEPSAAEKRFWRDTVDARRATLMPFFWRVVAARGQVFGDPARKSVSRVTNGLWFSYPGYNELLTGAPDPRIDSNDKVPNPNVTVLEWLNGRPGFQGRVAAFGTWDVLPFILNVVRSRLPVGDNAQPVPMPKTERERAINDLNADLPPYWPGVPFDAPIMHATLESLRTKQPRVLYVMLGETDEWAHEGRYDLYLDAAFRSDRFLERLWESLQALPGYANQTALILTTDHGRGATRDDWTDHGTKVPAAETTWMAVIGPGVPALGLRESVTVTASQVAATAAALVGENYRAAVPAAAEPLPGVIAGATRGGR